MTEQEALKQIQDEISPCSLKFRYKGYCTECGLDGKVIFYSDPMSMATECVDCYAKRRMNELAPQITEEDSKEVKEQRAQTVRDYFARRRST